MSEKNTAEVHDTCVGCKYEYDLDCVVCEGCEVWSDDAVGMVFCRWTAPAVIEEE